MDRVISTVLAGHPWLPPFALVLLVVLGPVAGWALVSRRDVSAGLCALSVAVMGVLTLTPGRPGSRGCWVEWSDWSWTALTAPETGANVIMFILPVLLAGVATRRPFAALLAGSALSAGIEFAQAVLPALGRACDTSDWQANTVGCVIGAVLAVLALAFHAERPLLPERERLAA